MILKQVKKSLASLLEKCKLILHLDTISHLSCLQKCISLTTYSVILLVSCEKTCSFNAGGNTNGMTSVENWATSNKDTFAFTF